MVQTFSMQPRDKTSPTAYEYMAVQRACHQLLSNVSIRAVAPFADLHSPLQAPSTSTHTTLHWGVLGYT